MPRRTLIIPLAVALVATLAWLTVPTVKRWLAPPSVVDIGRLRLGVTAGKMTASILASVAEF